MQIINPVFKIRNKRPVWTRKLVYSDGRYEKESGLIEVLSLCKNMGLPVIASGEVVDSEYFKNCINSGIACLKKRTDLQKVELFSISKVYICNNCDIRTLCEAICCGCYVICSSINPFCFEFVKEGFWSYKHKNYSELSEKLSEAYSSICIQRNSCWHFIDKTLRIF